MKSEVSKKENLVFKFLTKIIKSKVIVGVIILGVTVLLFIAVKETILSSRKTTKIGFEDIGELATQSAYCTQINVTDKSKDIFGVKIPLTQTKYIYSYDILIKAGFDFNDIDWNERGTNIEVTIPKSKILSSDIDLDSFEIYHEDESIFTKITMSENNDVLKDLKKNAEEDAIKSGILDNAVENAKTMLTAFFGNVYNLEEYKIIFKEK